MIGEGKLALEPLNFKIVSKFSYFGRILAAQGQQNKLIQTKFGVYVLVRGVCQIWP